MTKSSALLTKLEHYLYELSKDVVDPVCLERIVQFLSEVDSNISRKVNHSFEWRNKYRLALLSHMDDVYEDSQ